MSKLISNRDGGKSDEYATHLWRQRIFAGEVAEGCKVVANASPDMGVRVQAGTLRIPTGSAPSNFWYEGIIDTASPGESLTVTTANGSNPRKDYVVAYLDSTVTPSTGVTNNSNGMLKLAVVAGTAAASPDYPNNAAIQAALIGGASSPYIILAGINVGTSVTQITNSDITDLRSMAGVATVRNPYMFRAYSAANQTGIGANVWTTVVLGTEDYDPNSNFSSNTYTVAAPGLYQVDAQIATTGTAGLYLGMGIRLWKNGTTAISGDASDYDNNVTYDILSRTLSDCVPLSAGDTIVLQGILSLTSGTGGFAAGAVTRLSIHRVSI